MKRRTLIAGAGLLVLGLGLTAVAALPAIVEGRLGGAIDAAAESLVDVQVEVGDVDVAIYPTFPRITVTLTDVVVSGKGDFEGIDLAVVPEGRIGIDLFSAISGSTLVIESVDVTDPTVHIVYDEAGRANWDVLPEADADETDPYHLRLDHLGVTDLDIVWEDRAADLRTDIVDVDATATADLNQTLAQVDTRGAIESLTMRYGGVTWLQATKWKTTMAVDYNQETGAITFGENELMVNALPLAFSGTLAPTPDENWDVDMDVKATDTSVAALLSLVPEAYTDSFSSVDASGSVRLRGNVAGVYDGDSEELPSFGMELQIEGARFKHPDAPGSVDDLDAQLVIEHPGGVADLIRVRAEHFELSTVGSRLAGRFRLAHPQTDPELDLMADGRVDLGALRRALPQAADAPEVSGKLDLDFAVKGRMSDFENQRVGAVKAGGTLRGRDLSFVYDGEPVAVSRLDVGLSPTTVDLNDLQLAAWGSDVRVAGTVDNALPWMLTDDAVLGGDLTVESGVLDARPFQESDDSGKKKAPDSGEPVLVAVPDRVDVGLKLLADELITRDFAMRDVSGRVSVAEQTARLDRLKGDMLGGKVTLSGAYRAPTAESADIDLRVETVRVDLDQTVGTFVTLKLIAPVLEAARGRFDSELSLKTTLAADGTPDLSIVSSSGSLLPIGVTLQSAVLDTVASRVSPRFDALDVGGARVSYAFEDGRVELKPFSAKLGTQKATVSGGFGPLDKSLDLLLDVPVATKLLTNSPLVQSLGANLPRTADVRITVKGTYTKPKVGVGLKGDQAAELVDAALDPLVQQAMDQGDRLIDEAQKAADKLLAEARKAADVVVAEARTAGRKLRREAKGKPVQELAADKAADALVDQAQKQSRKLIREAEKGADGLVDQARKKKDKLVSDARAEVAAAATGGARRR